MDKVGWYNPIASNEYKVWKEVPQGLFPSAASTKVCKMPSTNQDKPIFKKKKNQLTLHSLRTQIPAGWHFCRLDAVCLCSWIPEA